MLEFTNTLVMGKPVWMWAVFMTVVVILLALDLGLFHRKPREIGVKESLFLSSFYIFIGLAFGGWVWINLGSVSGKEYLTGFLVEKIKRLYANRHDSISIASCSGAFSA